MNSAMIVELWARKRDGGSGVNRPVCPELGRNGAVFFEAGRGRTEGTAVIGRHPLMICESSYIIDIQL